MAVPNLLFIDTNIWLDFYRAHNETGLQLLSHTKAVIDKIIVTYQLESEFKTNRQTAILAGIQQLKMPEKYPRLGIFSDARETKLMHRSLKDADKRSLTLQKRLRRALEKPALHDPVYKAFQQVFHKDDDLSLGRDDKARFIIRRRAFKRFLHGCPPRKRSDTSIGDAFNWEWMIECAKQKRAGLVIVSRDSDYGVTLGDKSYVNDHLRQEFSDRVSRKRNLLLYTKLSEALKLFKVEVSPQEEEAEKELVSNALAQSLSSKTSPAEFASLLSNAGGVRLSELAFASPSPNYSKLLAESFTSDTHSSTLAEVGKIFAENAELIRTATLSQLLSAYYKKDEPKK